MITFWCEGGPAHGAATTAEGVAPADISPQWRDFDRVREECAGLAIEMALRGGSEE